jgi:hypothetical protein
VCDLQNLQCLPALGRRYGSSTLNATPRRSSPTRAADFKFKFPIFLLSLQTSISKLLRRAGAVTGVTAWHGSCHGSKLIKPLIDSIDLSRGHGSYTPSHPPAPPHRRTSPPYLQRRRISQLPFRQAAGSRSVTPGRWWKALEGPGSLPRRFRPVVWLISISNPPFPVVRGQWSRGLVDQATLFHLQYSNSFPFAFHFLPSALKCGP